jgi:hypothetical protein
MMRRAWVLLLALLLGVPALAEPPVDVARKVTKKPAAKPQAKAAPKARPAWAELTAEQQKVLSPLKADWDSLETARRAKWIGIAKRYPTMKAEEQERVTRRMQRWAALSPEQRRQARETYKQLAKSQAVQRAKLREQWAQYQALPERERQDLVPDARRKAK